MFQRICRAADNLFPSSAFKQRIRRAYLRAWNPLYAVARLVESVELVDHGVAVVELTDGTRLYGYADGVSRPVFDMADPARLGKLSRYGSWATFFQIIGEVHASALYSREYQLQPGDTVVDLGAHVGAFSVMAARAVGPQGRVVAFEPYDANFQLLQRNLILNGLTNVEVVRLGAWSGPGSLSLAVSLMSSSHSVYPSSSAAPRTGETVRIEVDSVDRVLESLGINRVAFVKMDIEGAELEALRGMEATIRESRPHLAVAAYHRVDGRETYQDVLAQVSALGLTARVIDRFVYAWPPS